MPGKCQKRYEGVLYIYLGEITTISTSIFKQLPFSIMLHQQLHRLESNTLLQLEFIMFHCSHSFLFSLSRQFAGLMSSRNLQLRKEFYQYHLQLYSIPPSSLFFLDKVLQCGLPLWWPPSGTWIPLQRSESITFISLSLSSLSLSLSSLSLSLSSLSLSLSLSPSPLSLLLSLSLSLSPLSLSSLSLSLSSLLVLMSHTFCRRSIDSPVRSWENAPPFSAFNRFRGGTREMINSLRARGKWREGKGVCMGWGSGWQVGICGRWQMREEKQGLREER